MASPAVALGTASAPRCLETSGSSAPLILACAPGFATTRDTVRIYLRSPSSDRFSDAVWVFEAGGDRPVLMVDFHPTGSGLVADLYDDQDGDGTVAFELIGGLPRVLESAHPTVSVTSRDGWWTKDGRTSFDLDIRVDGPVRASFSSSGLWPLTLLHNDGKVDFEIHVRDRDHDGDPEDDWRQDYPPLSEDPHKSGFNRTHIMSNPEGDEVPITGSFFWPYLGYAVGDFVKEYGVSRPPIAVDWKRAKIVQVGEFVASRGNPGNFFIYSRDRVLPGQTTATNFENPFAFYDLANSNDGWPDMSIRMEATLPGDLPNVPDDEPINTVRWSWDQDHAHQWDYALNLVGRQRVDQTIGFPDFSVLAVPPDRLPHWLAGQSWEAATFVQVMKPYWTTEGVYEYSVGDDDNVLPFRYVTGLDKNAPTAVFHDIPEGFRGEYSFDLDGLARIYLSPVDGHAHLVGADAGVWDLGRGREIRYENLGDEYIDHWSLLEGGRRIKDLYVAAGQILLTDAAGTRIGRMSSPQAAATFTPPRDHEEWNKLRGLLADLNGGPAPDDFEGMFRGVAEAPQSLKGAAIRDLRLSEDGFRFVLETDTRTPRWEGIGDVGSHVVRYVRGHGYATAPLTPAQAEVSAVSAIQETGDALEAIGLSATVANTGGEDIRGAAVNFFAGRDDGPSVAIGSSRIDMLSGATATANVRWTPPAAGHWTIHAAVGATQGAPSIVAVNQPPLADVSGIVAVQQLSSPVAFLAVLTLLCGALMAVSAGAGRLPEPWSSGVPSRKMADPVRARWFMRKYRAPPRLIETAHSLGGSPHSWLVGVLGVAALAGLYFVLRPDGRWAEADTALMTDAIRTVVRAGSLSPESGTLYPSGYGYPAVSATILAFTGLDVRVLQQLVYPLVSAAVVLPAWALYREVGGTVRVAAIATLFLLLIPEHLFTLLRGSHERMDRTFLLLLVWFIVRRARIGQSATQSALHMVVILLALYGLVAANVLFAMSVAAGLTMAALASWSLWRTSVAGSVARTAGVQLGWVAVAAWLLIVIFILVIYPPAMHTMDAISGLPAQIAQLISSSEGAVNPYASIPSAWVSPQVFIALSVGNLIVVTGSALTWVVLGRRWLRGERPRTGLWVLWLLYAAFAFQVALGTFVDRTGMLGGNLQYRAFAPFATLAAGLLAVGLSEIRPRAVIRVAGGIALAALAVAATLKASNEPVVSNKWTFYSPAEITGLEWADANLAGAPTWIGPDERLGAAYLTERGVPEHGDRWTHDELDPSVRAFVVSDIVRLQASRMGVTLPALAVQDRVYDNGETQIYRGEP